MAAKGSKLKIQSFDISGDRLSLGRSWQKWIDRFERELLYNGVDASNTDNSAVCQIALFIYARSVVEDLHDSLADIQRPQYSRL